MQLPDVSPALLHGPGAFSAFVRLRAAPGATADTLREAARALGSLGQLPGETWLLPLLAPSLVGRPEVERLLPRSGPGGHFPSTPTPLAFQVAAPSREGLVHALRRAEAAVAGTAVVDDELLGGKLGDGREPFGFRDGLWVPTPDEVRGVARIPDGPLAGGSWVLAARFVQQVEAFHRLPPHEQEQAVGRTRDGEWISHAPPGAHAHEQAAVSRGWLIRRGFPWRAFSEEGLLFVAAAREPAAFERALDAMTGASGPVDRLLAWTRPVSAAVYFAPPG